MSDYETWNKLAAESEVGKVQEQIRCLHRYISTLKKECDHPMTHRQQSEGYHRVSFIETEYYTWNNCYKCDSSWKDIRPDPLKDAYVRIRAAMEEERKQ